MDAIAHAWQTRKQNIAYSLQPNLFSINHRLKCGGRRKKYYAKPGGGPPSRWHKLAKKLHAGSASGARSGAADQDFDHLPVSVAKVELVDVAAQRQFTS
jgi:hypothetical protein